MKLLKKGLYAALLMLLTGTAAAAPAAPNAAAQLNIIAASPVLRAELDTVHTNRQSMHTDRPAYQCCAAVTDLDGNGRLELLISRQTRSYEPLLHAGDSISKEQKEGLAALCADYPIHFDGAAYEISPDGTHLMPLAIVYEGDIFPDLSNLYMKPRTMGGAPLYPMYTVRMTGVNHMYEGWMRYGIACDYQTVRLADGQMTIARTAHCEGSAGVYGDYIEADYTAMQILSTGEVIDPSRIPPELRRHDNGHRISCVSSEEMERGARAALARSYSDWTHKGAEVTPA